jgi:hypothetical protein
VNVIGYNMFEFRKYCYDMKTEMGRLHDMLRNGKLKILCGTPEGKTLCGRLAQMTEL